MKITDVPNVRIQPELVQKYILAEIIDRVGMRKYVIFGDPTACRHQFLVDELQEAGFKVVVHGGGRISSRKFQNRIYVWDYSGDFGRVNTKIAKDLLKREFQTFGIRMDEPPPGHDTKKDTW